MIPTHAVCVDGRTWMDIKEIGPGEHNDIAATLQLMDGRKFFSLLLWKLPAGKDLYQAKAKQNANDYIQCAGSADRMTVEVRRTTGGSVEHFVVGRAPSGNSRMTETIRWDEFHTVVAPAEVFAAAEAAEVFLSYHRTGWVPSTYVLRAISP